jgi:hypothetical protein
LQIKNNFLRLTPEQWDNVTQDEYDTYRVGTYWTPQLSAQLSAQQVAGTGALLLTAVGQPVDLVTDFQKGIQRDPNVYPLFKENSLWHSWRCAMVVQAKAHVSTSGHGEKITTDDFAPVKPQGLLAMVTASMGFSGTVQLPLHSQVVDPRAKAQVPTPVQPRPIFDVDNMLTEAGTYAHGCCDTGYSTVPC